MSSDIVLNFHDILLREYDIEMLYGKNWITDTIISFYLEYLENVVYKKEKHLAFVSPEVTQCIKMLSPNEVGVFLDPWDINNKEFIFFPVNDNQATGMPGGSHWSLVVLSQKEKTFFYFDSITGSNFNAAKTLKSKITPYCQKFEKDENALNGSFKLVPINSLQQENGYDCGIHLMCNIDVIVKHVLEKNVIYPNCPVATISSVKDKRSEILSIIKEMKSQNLN